MAQSDIQVAVCIDEVDIQAEFCRLPGDLAYYASQLAEAARRRDMAKFNMERVYSRTLLEEKAAAAISGTKLTVADTEARVVTSDAYEQARLEMIECEAAKAAAYGVLDAIRAKRDMLVSLGATQRAERASDPQINRNASGWQQ